MPVAIVAKYSLAAICAKVVDVRATASPPNSYYAAPSPPSVSPLHGATTAFAAAFSSVPQGRITQVCRRRPSLT
jgi:hypothetical protein